MGLLKRISFGTGTHSVELAITDEGKARLEIEGEREDDFAMTDEISVTDMLEGLKELVTFLERNHAAPSA